MPMPELEPETSRSRVCCVNHLATAPLIIYLRVCALARAVVSHFFFFFVYCIVKSDGPSYLSDLLKFYIPSRQLRSSSDTRLLRIPSFRLESFGQSKFSYQASVL